MTQKYEVIHYTENNKDIFTNYLHSLRDNQARLAIDRTVDKIRDGNFGNHTFCRDGVWEIVINISAGYRVYYSIIGNTVVLLLCAGSKRTQNKDIDNAVKLLKKYKEEH